MAKVKTIEIVDIENVRQEKLRYQKNTLAYFLGFGGIIFSIVAAFIELNTMKPNYLTMIYILLNIVVLLFGFLSCENLKQYQRRYSYVMFGFAVLEILRIFWYPLLFIRKWSHYKKMISNGDESANAYVQKYFSPQVYTTSPDNRGYMGTNGTLRGIVCIILIIISAVFFAFSGYVGYIKSKQLEKYLESINVDFKKR